MLIYVVVATPLHTRYILKDGKPVIFDDQLPQKTKRISYSIDRFDPIVLRGQNLYHLWGWAVVRGDPDPTAYERLIVLRSDNHIYFFSSVNQARPEIQAQIPELNLPLNTGFSAHISKDVIPLGVYRIGFLFRHRTSDTRYYLVTDRKIIRTPNKIQLVAP